MSPLSKTTLCLPPSLTHSTASPASEDVDVQPRTDEHTQKALGWFFFRSAEDDSLAYPVAEEAWSRCAVRRNTAGY
jgi:hypothetical protein